MTTSDMGSRFDVGLDALHIIRYLGMRINRTNNRSRNAKPARSNMRGDGVYNLPSHGIITFVRCHKAPYWLEGDRGLIHIG